MGKRGAIRIGISGWTYKRWRNYFYPKDLPHRLELAYASGILSSIEINGTFYSLQRPDAFARWAAETTDDFVFAVKAPRFITHMRRLREPRLPLANFLASGVLRLGPKLGPILWQFPPSLRYDPARMRSFLELLPHDTQAAADLAHDHDHRLDGRAWLATGCRRPMRHAVEIRHDSFRDTSFVRLLREHDVALVCADTVEWPRLMDLTSDFVYCRLHGSEELYRSGYDAAAIDRWAARARAWSLGKPMLDGEFVDERPVRSMCRDVYIYFDNTDKLRAPDDARALMQRLGPAAALTEPAAACGTRSRASGLSCMARPGLHGTRRMRRRLPHRWSSTCRFASGCRVDASMSHEIWSVRTRPRFRRGVRVGARTHLRIRSCPT